MQTVEHFPHGNNPVDQQLQLLRLHLIRRHALLAPQRGVQVVLPAQLVRGHHQQAGGVCLCGGRLLAFFLLGGCAAVRLSGDWLASARVARHDEGHRVQFIGGYKVQLLSFEVLKYRSGQITVFHLQTSKNKKHTFSQLFG